MRNILADIFYQIGTAFSLAGTRVEYDELKIKEDKEALEDDWNEIGKVMSEVLGVKYRKSE